MDMTCVVGHRNLPYKANLKRTGLDLGLGNWTWAFQFHIFGIAQDLSQRGQPLRVGLFSKNQMKECHQKTKPYQTSWEQHRIPFLDCSAV